MKHAIPRREGADLRVAVVLHRGVGLPVRRLCVKIDGVEELVVILAPPRDVPEVGETIAVRQIISESKARYWAHAGGR
jgi:hypothetical protein